MCDITILDFPHLFFYHSFSVLVIEVSMMSGCDRDISDQHLWALYSIVFFLSHFVIYIQLFFRIKRERVTRISQMCFTDCEENVPSAQLTLYLNLCFTHVRSKTLKFQIIRKYDEQINSLHYYLCENRSYSVERSNLYSTDNDSNII